MKPRSVIIALAACAAFAGCRSPGYPPATVASATPGSAVVHLSPQTTYLGVYEKSGSSSYRPDAAFAHSVGLQPNLVLYFSGWNEQFQSGFARQAFAHGAIPLVQINPDRVSLADIATGRYDPYLISYAGQVRAFAHPVVIGFAHEMNGWWYSWGYGNTPSKVWVAAWRHIVTLFRRHGALNVTWMWTISLTSKQSGPLRAYWPGSAYVNWAGIDGYYYTRGETFRKDFAPTVAAVRHITQDPAILAETGVGQVAGQATKIPNLFAGIRLYHLAGLVWYDVDQHAGLYHQNWRLEGHPAALRAFRKGVKAMMAGH